MVGGAAAAIMFLVGALLCLSTIMPVKFWLPGCEPGNWEPDVVAGNGSRLQLDSADNRPRTAK
jgi:hypothetical protein